MTFDPDTLTHAVDEAPEAGFPALNYGQLIVNPNLVSWEGEKGSRKKIVRPMGKGDKLKAGETLELEMVVKVSELNPALTFDYTRNVPVRKSSPKNRTLTDWTEIVEPSLIAVLGKEWPKAIAKQPYVCVEDAANIAGNTSEKTGKVYGVPRLVKLYKNRAECIKAREAQFGVTASSNGSVPTDLTEQVRGLVAAIRDKEQLVQLLAMEPYASSGFAPDVLLEAAVATGAEPF